MKKWHRIVIIGISVLEFLCICLILLGLTGHVSLSGPLLWIETHLFRRTNETALDIRTLVDRSSDTYMYYYDFPVNEIGTASASWLPHNALYHYNGDGFNEIRDYDKQKPSTTYRIMTLGDSFVFGMWVSTEENFSSLLETMLNEKLICSGISSFEVINAGAPSFDVRYSAKRYADKGALYTPDTVIWFIRDENIYFNTDVYRKLEEGYKEKIQNTRYFYFKNFSDPYAVSHLAYRVYMDSFQKLSKSEQSQFLEPEITALTEWRKTYSSDLIIATTADSEESYKEILQKFTKTWPRVWYKEIGDIQTFAKYDYHPDQTGHVHIAGELFGAVLRDLHLPCVEK